MEKILFQLLLEDRTEFLGKNEKVLEKGTGNVIEIDSNTVKGTIMKMKTGRPTGPGDIPIALIKITNSMRILYKTFLLTAFLNFVNSC